MKPERRDSGKGRFVCRRMIYSLPEPYREAVVLTELDALTQQELADRLGISLSGAKSRVQRGRAQLKRMLDECCTFEFERRGKVIDCTPRAKAGCEGCAWPSMDSCLAELLTLERIFNFRRSPELPS